MLPTISVVESKFVKEKIKSQYAIVINDIDLKELKNKDNNNTHKPLFFILFIFKQIIRLLRILKLWFIWKIINAIISNESSKPTTYSFNIYSRDDENNTIIWLVSGVEGQTIESDNVETELVNESGQSQPNAIITFNEVTGAGYVNPGDTFTVVTLSDGWYVSLLFHKISGATLYKSSLVHY